MLTDDKRSARVREALQSLADAFDYGTPCDSEMAIGVIEAELHRLTAALAEQTALREKAEAEVARWHAGIGSHFKIVMAGPIKDAE